MRNSLMLLRDARGFTLPELMVVMGIFVTVMLISANAFNTIVNSSSQQSKSAETNTGGIVGLEVLRADLEQSGFGLPWSFPSFPSSTFSYAEAVGDSTLPAPFWPTGVDASTFNDAAGNAPRAVLSGITKFNSDGTTGSNYLVIKSTLADNSDTSRKWTTISYDNNGSPTRKIWDDADRDFADTDQVIVVKNSLMTTPPTRQLMAPSSAFSATFGTYSTAGFLSPHQNGDTIEVYGINRGPDPTNPSLTDLRMPFNRADYYVLRPGNIPQSCMQSLGVGVLYKSIVVNHSANSSIAGKLSAGMPLLDCVADMQVVYGLDNDGAGRVNQYIDADPTKTVTVPATTSLPTAADIRSQLREIRVYILAHEGKKDRLFSYPSPTVMVGEVLNGVQRGRTFNLSTLGSDYANFRWKVYTIVVRPKNLGQ